MKGPGLRVVLDVRRLWRCSRCGRVVQTPGRVVAVPCSCSPDRPWMTLENRPARPRYVPPFRDLEPVEDYTLEPDSPQVAPEVLVDPPHADPVTMILDESVFDDVVDGPGGEAPAAPRTEFQPAAELRSGATLRPRRGPKPRSNQSSADTPSVGSRRERSDAASSASGSSRRRPDGPPPKARDSGAPGDKRPRGRGKPAQPQSTAQQSTASQSISSPVGEPAPDLVSGQPSEVDSGSLNAPSGQSPDPSVADSADHAAPREGRGRRRRRGGRKDRSGAPPAADSPADAAPSDPTAGQADTFGDGL